MAYNSYQLIEKIIDIGKHFCIQNFLSQTCKFKKKIGLKSTTGQNHKLLQVFKPITNEITQKRRLDTTAFTIVCRSK